MIVLADIHGRLFWKDAVKGNENEKIIFLGDYLDPYPDEWEGMPYEQLREDTITNFKEIIEFKKAHKDNVILLVGNHDLEYMVSTYICDCRRDRQNYYLIRDLFRDNKDLFDICYRENDIIFSHGGIRKAWVEAIFPDVKEDNLVDYLNNQFHLMMDYEYPEESTFAHDLACCSFYRGGLNSYSSLVWGDVREWLRINDSRPFECYQIFGHTRLYDAFVTEDWACLDCSKGFKVLDDKTITDMDGNPVEVRNIKE